MKRILFIFALIAFFSTHVGVGIAPVNGATSEVSASDAKSDDEKSVGGKSGQKGGIYVAGRAFKTAGKEMGKGFKAAGRGIKKGGKATGRAFKKAGGEISDFFTGENKH